ncbi:unnamed protein product, partial [Brassica rapa subsp. narinosa]
MKRLVQWGKQYNDDDDVQFYGVREECILLLSFTKVHHFNSDSFLRIVDNVQIRLYKENPKRLELSTRIYKNSKSNDPNRRREHTGISDHQVSLVIVSVISREFKSSHCLRMRAQTILVNAGKKRWDHTSKEIRNA